MFQPGESFGQTIQLFLVDGTPSGLIIASIYGWTGSVLVASQSTFSRLLARNEADRTGIYLLFGPDPQNPLVMRAYIGEADCVRERVAQSAQNRTFWENAIVITTSDESLTKGHVRYLEARLIELASSAGRVSLDNSQSPDSERRRLPEADKANMEAFLAHLRIILPVIGLDLLKPKPSIPAPTDGQKADAQSAMFEIRHRSGVRARAFEYEGDFVVMSGSEALKDAGYESTNYADLKKELIQERILKESPSGDRYVFDGNYIFRSPSAAAAVVLDRNSNGRREWKVVDSNQSYDEWQKLNVDIPFDA